MFESQLNKARAHGYPPLDGNKKIPLIYCYPPTGITSTFIDLTDAPNSYLGSAGKVVTVNNSEDGLIFTTSSGGSGVSGFTYSENKLIINNSDELTALIDVMTGLTITGNLFVQKPDSTSQFSSSSQNVLTIIGSGNSTTAPLFRVQGSQGELFTVNDNLNGSLFSVNNISGLPILEVFSDNRTIIGDYLAPSLYTTVKKLIYSGITTLFSIPISAYTSASLSYNVANNIGSRCGELTAIWSGSNINYVDTVRASINSTTNVNLSAIVSGSSIYFISSAATSDYTFKSIIKSI